MAFASIPVLAWLAAALLLLRHSGPSRSVRDSLLAASVLAGGWLVLGTELLGLSRAVRFGPVLLWWAVPALAMTILLARDRSGWREWLPGRPRLARGEWLLLAGVLFPLGWSLCQALLAPPNNIDSLSYHLPRQVYWMQQASVENYATSSLRQIAMPPLTEFAGLHLMVLTGSDRFHNLVQWTALVLTLGAVSLLTRRFGGTALAQLLSALWVATIPMAFLQASNTKNDVVVALWTCLLGVWVLRLATDDELPLRQAFLIGLAFGLLVLTKGTGLVFGLPIAGLMLVLLLRRHRRRALPALLVMTFCVVALNAGALLRNHAAFGTPFPNDPAIHGGQTLVNELVSGRALVSNAVRNVAPHLASPSAALNGALTRVVLDLHERLGLDVNDPRTTFLEGRFRGYSFTPANEDYAAAPVHALMLLLLLPGLALARSHDTRAPARMLLLLAAAAFLLFCLALKWQVWHVRLVVALLALPAPVVAWAVTARGTPRLALAVGSALLLGLLPSLDCEQRPLLGPQSVWISDPDSIRFYPATDRGRTMAKQAERMNELQPRTVGVSTPWSFAEYLLQRALLDKMARPPIFTAFNATLQVPEKPEPDPDVLLVGDSGSDRIQHASTGTWYVKQGRLRPYDLYLKDTAPP
jgi:hypothetical protein